MLAVYYSLANFPTQKRSTVDHMQLVMLCKEKELKSFGVAKCFSRLIQELQDLGKNGILLPGPEGEHFHVKLLAILGDNLGSHEVGGFQMNFSNGCLCRYCIASGDLLHSNTVSDKRTVDNYNEALTSLANNPSEKCKDGVKMNSPFNAIDGFHVCDRLPPCLAHDLFEGMAAYDLHLFITYFINSKWFSLEHLNCLIDDFPYQGTDASNKPCPIKEKKLKKVKLSGNASQNWCLLRLLPLILEGHVKDWNDKVWLLFLSLRNICDYICGPKISKNDVACLKQLLQDYRDEIQDVFPDYCLKAKHHYVIVHYPELILKFGPLIHLWTLRFESKHKYFKRCVKQVQNFINITKSLAEKHQLLQAYLLLGSPFPADLEYTAAVGFHFTIYNEVVQEEVSSYGINEHNAVCTKKLNRRGTVYKEGLLVVLKLFNYSLVFGEIQSLVVKNNNHVYFILKIFSSTFLTHLNAYELFISNELSCVPEEKLLDFYPLPGYKIKGKKIVVLKHNVAYL